MSEYWDNYEPFDQEIESLKDTLRDSVNEETKALIASLQTDNADLRKTARRQKSHGGNNTKSTPSSKQSKGPTHD